MVASMATKAELKEAIDTMIEEVSGFLLIVTKKKKKSEVITFYSQMRAPGHNMTIATVLLMIQTGVFASPLLIDHYRQ